MKIILILIILWIGYWGTKNYVPPQLLISLYGFIAMAPVVMIVVRKFMFQSLLVYFVFIMFQRLWRFQIPLIPDMPPDRIVCGLVVVFFLADLAMNKRKIIPGSKSIEVLMLLFCIYAVFSGIFAGSIYVAGQGLSLVFLLKGYIMPFTIFFLAKNLIYDEQKIRQTFLFFSFIGLYLGLTGIFEHFRLNFLVFPSYIMIPSIGLHWGQARGPFVQAGVNGMVIGMIFFIVLLFFLNARKRKEKVFCFIALICLLTTLLFTYNRASWVAFAMASIIIPVFIPRLRKIYIVCFLVLCLFLMAGFGINMFYSDVSDSAGALKGNIEVKDAVIHRFKSKGSFYARVNIFMTAVRMISEKPFLGFGYNMFKVEAPNYFGRVEGVPFNIKQGLAVHNSFIIILVEYGLIGLCLFLSLAWSIFRMSKRLYHKLPPEGLSGKVIVVVFWGFCIIYFIGMQFREMHYDMFSNGLFFLMAGILSGLEQRLKFRSIVTA